MKGNADGPMKPERWQQVKEIYQAALEHRPPERAAFLDDACAGEAELRREVESLLDQKGNVSWKRRHWRRHGGPPMRSYN